MKSPSTSKGRLSGTARKGSIIGAAATLFAKKGFNGTKTRQIAELAGVSEALIFKHFPGKHELYAAILAQKSPVPGLVNTTKKMAQKRDDIGVLTVIAETILQGAPDPHLLRLILFSALENHELSDMFFQEHIRHFYDFLAGYVEKRIQDGAFKPVPPLVVAQAFMGMLIYQRLLNVLFLAPPSQHPEEMAKMFVRVFLDGLKAPAGGKKARRGRAILPKKPRKQATR